MESKKKFDSNKYKQDWARKNKRQFKVDLNVDEYNDLCFLLNRKNITKVDFVRNAFKELQKK
ncbi:MAG: hypothetical protein SOT91_03780 [Bacilli bacterium]|nr:hypothetical protein [Bacilli bacterium]